MHDRKITDINNAVFKPFDRYGKPLPKMSWSVISYESSTGFGSFLLKMEPGARSAPHTHTGFEEFFIVEGELIDSDGAVFKKGDFVSFEPGSKHSSATDVGALLIVFQRGLNQQIKGV